MSFNTIKGQEQAIKILRGFLAQSKFQGGYVFLGPEGVGKKLAALAFAQALMCEQSTADPCGQCASCRKIGHAQHPDVRVIDGTEAQETLDDAPDTAVQIKIEHIRQLQREISLRPFEGKKKVFIIDNAHTLTAEASSALLKVLEEPPGGGIIILITDKPMRLLKTVISRCKIVKFSPLNRQVLEEILRQEFSLDAHEAHYLAYACEGRIGTALRMKDSEFLQEKNRLIDAFLHGPRAFQEEPGLTNRTELCRQLNTLSFWFRDLYLLKIGLPHAQLINIDRKDDLVRSINRYSFSELNDIFTGLSETVFYAEHNVNAKLLLNDIGAKVWKG